MFSPMTDYVFYYQTPKKKKIKVPWCKENRSACKETGCPRTRDIRQEKESNRWQWKRLMKYSLKSEYNSKRGNVVQKAIHTFKECYRKDLKEQWCRHWEQDKDLYSQGRLFNKCNQNIKVKKKTSIYLLIFTLFICWLT